MINRLAIGVDIGGSHINCCALDVDNNELVKESQTIVKVDGHAEADEIIQKWLEALNNTLDKVNFKELTGIGFAIPGPFDYTNGIGKYEVVDKFEHLNKVNIEKEIRKGLALDNNIPIRFINDATAFALGEASSEQGKGYEKVAVITLGTGLGSAFIDDLIPVVTGKKVPEFGCVWHLPFKDGIADEYFSTRWFINEYFKLTNKKESGVKPIADMVIDDPVAKQLFNSFGVNLASFMLPYLSQFDAQVLVIGGNIAGAFPLFKNSFKEKLKENGLDIDISVSELKEDAAILGSTCLLDRRLWKDIKPTLKYM